MLKIKETPFLKTKIQNFPGEHGPGPPCKEHLDPALDCQLGMYILGTPPCKKACYAPDGCLYDLLSVLTSINICEYISSSVKGH